MNLIRYEATRYQPEAADGIFTRSLWRNELGNEILSVLLSRNSRLPEHGHPGWEHIFVVYGSLTVGDQVLGGGDYLFTDVGEIHDVKANEDSEILIILQKGMSIPITDPSNWHAL